MNPLNVKGKGGEESVKRKKTVEATQIKRRGEIGEERRENDKAKRK